MIKKWSIELSCCLLFILCWAPRLAAGEEARFMTSADIHKDQIVFSYEGDLWLTSAAGGAATRLTSFPGDELYPRFSPDGHWIAFLGNYDGQPAVYVIASDGGEPRRLTYAPGIDRTVAWTPDGKQVIFSTTAEKVIQRDPTLYSVALDGTTAPERMPIDRGSYCSFSPDGRRMVYNRRTYMPVFWKRYKGGQHSDLWLYDYGTKKFESLSDFDGKNAHPMWIDGKIYFVSDRFGGVGNLCALTLETHAVTQATHHEDYDVENPASDGTRIVYLQNGYLNIFDGASGMGRRLTITLPSDHWQRRDRVIDPRSYIREANVANSGKLVAIEARGDLFAVPAGKGQLRNLSRDCGSRELYPRISPDGKTVAFFSDRSGDYQLYLQPAQGGAWTQLTTTLDHYPDRLEWSPDGKKLLFGTRRTRIYVLEVASKQLQVIDETVAKDGTSGFDVGDFAWASDSNWICYTSQASNDNSRIFLYSLEQKKRYPVTSEFYDNNNPRFDKNGQYLYYLSNRNFDIRMDGLNDDHIITNPSQVMVVQLRAGQKPPFAEADDEEATSASKSSGDAPARMQTQLRGQGMRKRNSATPARSGAAATTATAATTHTAILKIDTDGFAQRTFPLPVPAGDYGSLNASTGRVMWIASSSTGGGNRLHIFDMKEKKDAVVEDSIRSYSLSVNGDQILLSLGSSSASAPGMRRMVSGTSPSYAISSVDKLRMSKKAGEPLKLEGMIYTIDTEKEWTQIFNDAWRWYRDYFYDANMHGHDWKTIGEHYRAMIPKQTSREGLNRLMQEMVGELCASHCFISGGDTNSIRPAGPPIFTGLLGADLAWDEKAGAFRLKRIYGPTDFNLDLKGPLVRPDIKVKEGDWLLAIDDQPLRSRADYHRLLQVTRGQKVKVLVSDKPTTQSAHSYEVEPLDSDKTLRYYRWVSDNIEKVSKATNGRVGYMHFRDMSANTVAEFDKFWRAYHDLDGVIVDVRGNSGGNTEAFLIDKMERQRIGFFARRDTAIGHYPYQAGNLKYVALTNEDNASCGEMFIGHFKARGLGKVIGTHSWGGEIWIYPAMSTVDGGQVQEPNSGFFGRDGKWWIENRGADPDIDLDNDPGSVMDGHDLQLEKAIEVIKAEIEQAKKDKAEAIPPRPDYPKR